MLEPVIRDPDLAARLAAASPPSEVAMAGEEPPRRRRPAVQGELSALAYVVGVILGSPEFQRR
jgi:hypothetical protein